MSYISFSFVLFITFVIIYWLYEKISIPRSRAKYFDTEYSRKTEEGILKTKTSVHSPSPGNGSNNITLKEDQTSASRAETNEGEGARTKRAVDIGIGDPERVVSRYISDVDDCIRDKKTHRILAIVTIILAFLLEIYLPTGLEYFLLVLSVCCFGIYMDDKKNEKELKNDHRDWLKTCSIYTYCANNHDEKVKTMLEKHHTAIVEDKVLQPDQDTVKTRMQKQESNSLIQIVQSLTDIVKFFQK